MMWIACVRIFKIGDLRRYLRERPRV